MLAVRTAHTGGVCSTSLRDGGARSDPGMDHVERAGRGRETRGYDYISLWKDQDSQGSAFCYWIKFITMDTHLIYVSFDAFWKIDVSFMVTIHLKSNAVCLCFVVSCFVMPVLFNCFKKK